MPSPEKCQIEAVLHQAACRCEAKQLRFTPLRQTVLELVLAERRAVKAYELIEWYGQKTASPAAPPTIYRTLDFLLEHTFIHRIESMNAYIGCAHPEGSHICQFLICTACGHVDEMHQPLFEQAIQSACEDIGFLPQHQAIELTGLCAGCQ